MKTIDTEIAMRIHYSMSWEEADLIFRVTDGYVALARTLTKEVSTRFPESKEALEAKFSSLREGIGAAIARANAAAEVHAGRSVAVTLEDFHRMQERIKKLEAEAKERREKDAEKTG